MGELVILDPSRKMPECWTLISVMKFARLLKSKAAESRSYLSRILCCRSSAGRDTIDCDPAAQTTIIDLDDTYAQASKRIVDVPVIDLDGDLDQLPDSADAAAAGNEDTGWI